MNNNNSWREMAWVELYDIIQDHDETDEAVDALFPIIKQAQIEILESCIGGSNSFGDKDPFDIRDKLENKLKELRAE